MLTPWREARCLWPWYLADNSDLLFHQWAAIIDTDCIVQRVSLCGVANMRCESVRLLLVLALLSVGASADNSNNYINPPRTLPTPYGLKIFRSSDTRSVGPMEEIPGIGMSMGIYPISEDSELPVAGLSLLRYLESVESAEATGGAYSADLAEPLVGIGYTFQSQEKHPQAMNFFRRALHLSRINEGLYSQNQLPVLAGMINSQMAMGQFSRVDENQDYRFRVQRHVYEPGDPGLLQATLEYSEWQRSAYLEGLGGETYLRLLDMHDVHSREIERRETAEKYDPVLILHLRERLRSEYLVSQYEGEKDPEFQINLASSMEKQFAINTDLDMQRFKMIKKNNFRNGRNDLLQIVDVLEQQEPPDAVAIARARIALGDWYLWWDWLARGLQSYQEAYDLLAQDGDETTDPEALFAELVELPEERIFHPGAITPQADRQARAVVMFDVSRVGRVRKMEIVEMEAPNALDARIALFNMLREIRFRPHVSAGEVVAVKSVVREYRFEY
jgi:tetratricopeptide (TPR) repeat protein